MAILSITFHTPYDLAAEWETFTEEKLTLMADNLMDVEHYILSAVESDMVQDGSNTNLLLIFENDTLRQQFEESELVNITEHVEAAFGDRVMVFCTRLNSKKLRL